MHSRIATRIQMVPSAGLALRRDIVRPQASVRALCLLIQVLTSRHGPKRYLDHPDIVLDITQLLGTCSQKIIFLSVMHP
jgi:hypothetical protein